MPPPIWQGWRPGGNVTDGGSWKSGEVSRVHPLLTSCCAAQVLTGLELVLIPGPGVGNPWDKTLKQRFHPGWQRGWKALEDNEPRTSRPQPVAEMVWNAPGQGPCQRLRLGAGPFLLTSMFCRNFGMSPPRNLDMLVFCICGALFISRDPVLRVSCWEGMCLPTFSPKCLHVHYPAPKYRLHPRGASLRLLFWAECDATLHFAGFVHIKTNKQRPKHTPAGLLSEN